MLQLKCLPSYQGNHIHIIQAFYFGGCNILIDLPFLAYGLAVAIHWFQTPAASDVEVLVLCQERKRFVREALDTRCALAASHCAYILSFRETGSLLRKCFEESITNVSPARLHLNHMNAGRNIRIWKLLSKCQFLFNLHFQVKAIGCSSLRGGAGELVTIKTLTYGFN